MCKIYIKHDNYSRQNTNTISTSNNFMYSYIHIHTYHQILPRTWPCTSTSASIWCSLWPQYLSTSLGAQTNHQELWRSWNERELHDSLVICMCIYIYTWSLWLFTYGCVYMFDAQMSWDDLEDWTVQDHWSRMYIIRCLYVDVFSACVWRVVSFLDSQPVVEWGDTRLGTLGTTMSVEWILGPGFFMCPLPCGAGVVLKLVLVCTSDVGWTYCTATVPLCLLEVWVFQHALVHGRYLPPLSLRRVLAQQCQTQEESKGS